MIRSHGPNCRTEPYSRRATTSGRRGFSAIELLIVVAIGLIVGAAAVPILLNVLNSAKLRGEMSDLSGIVQACRSQAVKQNTTRHLYFTTSGGETVAYVDTVGQTAGTPDQTLQQVWLPHYIDKVSAPTTAPTPLTAGIMWGGSSTTLPDTTHDVCFNSRGIPCTCTTTTTAYCPGITNGYAFYFTFTSQPGGTRWAAVGVSPAGRIKSFFWNGSSWSN